MTRVTLARLFTGLLGVLALWPLVQHLLAVHYDVNPWKLFGMAMYCTPHSIQLQLWDRTTEPRRELDLAALSLETRQRLQTYRAEREALGRLSRPDKVARQVLAELPETKLLEFKIGVTRLDPHTARSSTTWRWYRYGSAVVQ